MNSDKENSRKQSATVGDLGSLLIFAAAIIVIIAVHQIPLFSVDGNSMNQTFTDGDLLSGKKHAKIHRGDILVLYSDVLEERIVKRCIGLPGDTVEIRSNTVYVNGDALTEDYINEPMQTPDLSVTLGDGEYFVMGDNRNHSTDSRDIGPISQDNIIATVTHDLTAQYHFTTTHLKWAKRLLIALAGCYLVCNVAQSLWSIIRCKKQHPGEDDSPEDTD